ncbi:alpha/beta hydrolase [Paenarthrobacter ureafaciens]|uniref:alpha/beta hydrolase n=1 Tax=Paenarthrobacter ureafaciens TaxID=37931 RepID=UPI002DBD9DE3|nr:alpha/beta hydrolase [Paenarthrobacter ureafaciens]MEC3853637.1 alpha/beta hydrolase [Paenarthrobacter ureafaciens]
MKEETKDMAETGTQNTSSSIASQLIRGLELQGQPRDPRTDIDHLSLVSIYPELNTVSTSEVHIPTSDGGVPARLYRPAGDALAGFVWVHGGAFIAGNLDMPEAHWVSLHLASQGISVLSLDYRKALHGVKYPAPSNDVLAGWSWASENPGALGLSSEARLHLGGASAGAALTASLTARLRDGAGVLPASLLLAYPLVHAELPELNEELRGAMTGVPADLAFDAGFIRDINLNFVGSEDNFKDPYAFAGEDPLAGFPPVYVINAESDTLRASGELFVEQLQVAGVSVRMDMEPGSMHGHLDHPHTEPARKSVERMLAWLLRGNS